MHTIAESKGSELAALDLVALEREVAFLERELADLPPGAGWDFAPYEPPTLEELWNDVDGYLDGLTSLLFEHVAEGHVDDTLNALHATLDQIKAHSTKS